MHTTRRTPWRAELVRLAFHSHRTGLLGWSLGLGAPAWWFGAIYQETIRGSGGAAAFAATAQPTADAMRPITGPAERLDTYGGYFTYHNVGYVALFLAIYAAIQGARAIRGDEERGIAELWLAAGRPRWTLVRDRLAAFSLVLIAIVAIAGLGTGLGAVAAGEPHWGAGFAVMGELALTALVGYGLGMLVSQVVATGRGAATIVCFALVALYLVNNMANTSAVLAVLRWVSPFALAEQSRALIPGHGVDVGATLGLAALALALAAAAAVAYQARDSAGALVARSAPSQRPEPALRLGRLSSRDLWLLSLREQRLPLVGWALLAGVLEWLYVALSTQVLDAWAKNPLVRDLFFRGTTGSLADQYISFTVVITAGVAVAFVVVQAARWLGDIEHGRAEMALAHAVGRSRLVAEWAASLAAGVALIAAAGVAGLSLGAWSAAVSVSVSGLVRTLWATVLLALGAGGVALLVVVWLRSAFAVAALTLLLAASWLVVLFGGLAHLPDWLIHLSIFDAFGTPYIAPLRNGGIVYLAGLAAVGSALAALVTSRRSGVST